MRSVLADMSLNRKEIHCKRVLGLDVYYTGEPPKAYFEVKDHTGHIGRK